MPVTEIAFDAVRERLSAVEQRLAVRDESMKAVSDCLSKIEAILSRITWILLGTIFAAAAAFMVNGGLSAGSLSALGI